MKHQNPSTKFSIPGLLIAILASVTLSAFAQEAPWTTNYAKAAERAKTENKAILLDFTGSDWCGWCMKMKKETLDSAPFKEYASKNLVLVEVDFPHNKPQPESVKTQNQQLSEKYQVNGFPSFVLLSHSGKVLWQQVGYLEGGPEAFLAAIKKTYHGAPAATPGDDFDTFFKKPAQSPTPATP